MAEKVLKHYNRDSFNRFDDKLFKVILSYLPLSESFRLQCVSQRFDALIFTGQTRLNITDVRDKNAFIEYLLVTARRKKLIINVQKPGWYEVNTFIINKQLLEYVLGKCVNITELTIKGEINNRLYSPIDNLLNDEILSIIGNNCNCLKHLTIKINANTISLASFKQFAEKCFANIESLSMDTYYNPIESNPQTSRVSCRASVGDYTKQLFYALLPITAKLKSIESYVTHNIFDNSSHIKQQWNQIESVKNYEIIDDMFIRFADNYAHQIKSLTVLLNDKNDFNALKHLSDFKSIEYLYCDALEVFDPNNTCERDLIEALARVGTECTRLRVLAIDGLRKPFFEVIGGGFKSLQKLIVKNTGRERYENFALLSNCANLTHLQFSNADMLTASFDNIHRHLPQLKSFSNDLVPLWYREILKHLQHLPNLYELNIEMSIDRYNDGVSDALKITTEDVIAFIANCKSIRKLAVDSMLSTFDRNVIREYIIKKERKTEIY